MEFVYISQMCAFGLGLRGYISLIDMNTNFFIKMYADWSMSCFHWILFETNENICLIKKAHKMNLNRKVWLLKC